MGINRRRFLRDSSLLISAVTLGAGMSACSREPASQAGQATTEAQDVTKKVELLGSYWTMAGGAIPHSDKEYSPFDFKDRVEAMSRAGFTGLGLWHADLDHILETRSLKEIKQIMDDNGIKHLELEFLTDWFVNDERRKQSDSQRAKLLEAAEALSARHIKVGHFTRDEAPMSQLVESFAELCADAANVGTRIGFELMPFSMINTLEDTLTMIEGANADNGGVILDTWHVFKIGIPHQNLAKIPKRFLIGVELNDGYINTPEGMTMREEVVGHRLLCGEGEFDLRSFLASMEKVGYDGPYGVEVLNNELRTWPLEKVVTRAYQTTMAQFNPTQES